LVKLAEGARELFLSTLVELEEDAAIELLAAVKALLRSAIDL
jgi:hypothetical protein